MNALSGQRGSGFVYVWRYEVPRRNRVEFERIYGSNGGWVALFRTAPGYRSTQLLTEHGDSGLYLTIDEWDSREDYERFRSARAEDFEELDAKCARLTSTEQLVGLFSRVE